MVKISKQIKIFKTITQTNKSNAKTKKQTAKHEIITNPKNNKQKTNTNDN